MTEMIPTPINGRWNLILPKHRHDRPEWATGWERERLDSMHANVKPGDVVIDIGTEEGDISALLASWVINHNDWANSGGVVLMEPNPRVWPNVRAIWEANGLPDPLGWWVGFAGPESELGTGDRYENWNGSDDTWPVCATGAVIGDHGFCNLWERPDIDKITLDDLMVALDLKPDAITMDTEGSELRVLQGAERILTEDRPLVWISVHPEFSVDMYGTTRLDLLRHMQARDYICRWLATDHEEHWLFHPKEGQFPN